MLKRNFSGDHSYQENITKGYKYYIETFFTSEGIPKYFCNSVYPIEIHCPGQLLVTLEGLHRFEENRELAEKVLEWSVKNMQNRKSQRNYDLLRILIALAFIAFLIVFLKQEKEILITIVTAILSFIGGFGLGKIIHQKRRLKPDHLQITKTTLDQLFGRNYC